MQFRFADYIQEHHRFEMYKVSKDYKKAKTLWTALDKCQRKHDEMMEVEIIENFKTFDKNNNEYLDK